MATPGGYRQAEKPPQAYLVVCKVTAFEQLDAALLILLRPLQELLGHLRQQPGVSTASQAVKWLHVSKTSAF